MTRSAPRELISIVRRTSFDVQLNHVGIALFDDAHIVDQDIEMIHRMPA